jgi:MFS family permease
MHQGLTFISVVISINVIVIVLAQPVMTRLLERRSEVFGLRVAVTLWVSGYLAVGVLSVAPSPLPTIGLISFATLFALGECVYSFSYHPWLISRVPELDLTRANALSNSMMGVGLFAGPTIGVAAGHHRPGHRGVARPGRAVHARDPHHHPPPEVPCGQS